jgi:hypothetical protein
MALNKLTNKPSLKHFGKPSQHPVKANLKGALLNARSLGNKMNDLKLYFHDQKLDFICITETWLDQTPSFLKEINWYCANRNSRGGGVAIMISSKYPVKIILTDSKFGCEFLCIEIGLSGMKLKLCVVYRPPNCTFENTKRLFKTLKVLNSQCLLCGDFNFSKNHIVFSPEIEAVSSIGHLFYDFCNELGFISRTPGPSRGGINGSWLDLCLENSPLIISAKLAPGLANSDHDSLLFDINFFTKTTNIPTRYSRNYSAKNIESLNRDFVNLDPNFLTKIFTLDGKTEAVMGTILSHLDKHMPLVKIQCNKPNYPKTLKASIKEKFKLWKLYKRDPENYKKKYDSLCLYIKTQIKNLAAKQEKLTLSKSVSHVYKYSNNIIRPRRSLPSLIFNNKHCIDDFSKAQAFGDVFSKSFQNLPDCV